MFNEFFITSCNFAIDIVACYGLEQVASLINGGLYSINGIMNDNIIIYMNFMADNSCIISQLDD